MPPSRNACHSSQFSDLRNDFALLLCLRTDFLLLWPLVRKREMITYGIPLFTEPGRQFFKLGIQLA
jgi:hypothetical protein